MEYISAAHFVYPNTLSCSNELSKRIKKDPTTTAMQCTVDTTWICQLGALY